MKATASVHITNKGVWVNGKPAFEELFSDSSKKPFVAIYKSLEISYPKFYKMDSLSKLGFIATEILKQHVDFDKYGDQAISQIFTNSYSSLDTDVKHQESLNKNAMPSPAVFVYTLPNIVMGEIAIRNKFHGENIFTLASEFSPERWLDVVDVQFKMNKAEAVLGGWIDLMENSYDLRLFFVEKDNVNGQYNIQ